MAREVSGDIRRFGTKRFHDWDSLFNGKAWELVEGQDFDSFNAFRMCAYRVAKERGVTLATRKTKTPDGKLVLMIQAV